MSFSNNFFDDNSHFVISFELLELLRWLVEHDQEGLKKVIHKCLHQGLKQNILARKDINNDATTEELHHYIIDFFSLLEILMQEVIQEENVDTVMKRSILPAINNIDTTMYDASTLSSSIAKATSLGKNSHQSPKEILCKELLKRWKPAKKASYN